MTYAPDITDIKTWIDQIGCDFCYFVENYL